MVRRNRKISRLPRKSLVVLRRQKAIDAFVYYFSKLEMGLGQRTHKLYDMSAAARQDRQAMCKSIKLT